MNLIALHRFPESSDVPSLGDCCKFCGMNLHKMEKFWPETILLRQYQTMCSGNVLGLLAYVTLKMFFKTYVP